MHRNVIFRNEVVPELPISAVDQPKPIDLWRSLQKLCLDTDGDCDVLAIPHNPNHASGYMFPLSNPNDPIEERREHALLSASFEPLVEMMQVKGESECRNGMWGVTGAADEFCDLEKYEPLDYAKDCEGELGFGKAFGQACLSRNGFARYAVAAGLQEQKALGINPYRIGFIGSTDTHNGTPGDVEEWNFEGSRGLSDANPKQRMKNQIKRSPGGLVGVWAEENSREALFDAMRRREVFATSGTRMKVRFFASNQNLASNDEQAANWCDRPDALTAAYENGIPMGGEITGNGKASTYFAIQAQRDPGTLEHPGGLLQRLQVIKVQAKDDGNFHQQVFDVAGGNNDATVDTETCTPTGAGADGLCAVWQDHDFNADEAAAYYVRAIENPSCKWNTWSCLSLPKAERPTMCDDASLPKTTQERAWSSPIWYTPSK